jgi:hypothetical protein
MNLVRPSPTESFAPMVEIEPALEDSWRPSRRLVLRCSEARFRTSLSRRDCRRFHGFPSLCASLIPVIRVSKYAFALLVLANVAGEKGTRSTLQHRSKSTYPDFSWVNEPSSQEKDPWPTSPNAHHVTHATCPAFPKYSGPNEPH